MSFYSNIIPYNCVSNKKKVDDEDKHQLKTPEMLKSLSDTTTLTNILSKSQLMWVFTRQRFQTYITLQNT